MYKDEASFNKLKGKFFESFHQDNIKCLEPSESCTERLINSHSIQDSRILTNLASNQHVICLRTDLTPIQKSKLGGYNPPDVKFDSVSIHTASTFKGLCNAHDTKIFLPIDTEVLNLEKAEHVFLLTYRAVLKELATLIKTSKMMQQLFISKVNLGEVSGTEPSAEGMIPVMQFSKAFEFYEYKKQFDEMYLASDFREISWKYLMLDDISTFAVSSIFTPMEMSLTPRDPERIGINLFSYENKSYVLFSCLKADEKKMNLYIDPIFQANGYYQKYLISKLVLRNCENITFSPDTFNLWSAEKKRSILEFFKKTMFGDHMDFEDKNLYLF